MCGRRSVRNTMICQSSMTAACGRKGSRRLLSSRSSDLRAHLSTGIVMRDNRAQVVWAAVGTTDEGTLMNLLTTAFAAVLGLIVISPTAPGWAEHLNGRDMHAFHEEDLLEHQRDYDFQLDDKLNAGDAEILVELVGIPNFAKINAMRLQIRRAI